MPAVKAISEGVDVSTGVWSGSESMAMVEATVAGLVGIVIFGLAFSTLAWSLVEGPGLMESSGSIFMPPKEGADGFGSESESDSSILQMGRWASRTSSSFSFSFCNSAISFCKRDFSSSSRSVSYTRAKQRRDRRMNSPTTLFSSINVMMTFTVMFTHILQGVCELPSAIATFCCCQFIAFPPYSASF